MLRISVPRTRRMRKEPRVTANRFGRPDVPVQKAPAAGPGAGRGKDFRGRPFTHCPRPTTPVSKGERKARSGAFQVGGTVGKCGGGKRPCHLGNGTGTSRTTLFGRARTKAREPLKNRSPARNARTGP